ncbi:endonuclease V [Cystobacter fuscus]
MLACVDVHYQEHEARGALLLFADWATAVSTEQRLVHLPAAAEYQPGQFYERELPVLLALLSQVDQPLATVIIDGYVWLGSSAEKGWARTCTRRSVAACRWWAWPRPRSRARASRCRCREAALLDPSTSPPWGWSQPWRLNTSARCMGPTVSPRS